MVTQRTQGHPVLIIGAGRGGTALLEMFIDDSLFKVVAIADINPDAPGMHLAKKFGIATYVDVGKALQACREYPDCIVYNMSHDDVLSEEASRVLGGKRAASGAEVKLFWQMVTNLKQIKGELEKSQSQLQAVIHNVMDGIITTNESGEMQGFNPAAEEIFGYSQQEVLGKNASLLVPGPEQIGLEAYAGQYAAGQGRLSGMRRREMTAVRKNGQQFPMEVSLSEMRLGGSRYFVGIVRDITERKLAEQKISHLAHYDYLTDLPNRALFMYSLGKLVPLAKRSNGKLAVLFLDLDGFKQVNDRLGHEAGDLLLQQVSGRLRDKIRASDMLARLGGDEFTLVLNDIGSNDNALLVADKIIAELSAPFDLNGQRCHVGGSIGISIFPDDAEQAEILIKQADEAMYLAKRSGRNTCKFFREVSR